MNPTHQKALAEKLLALHHGPHILVLPNAWDAASARIFELAGFPAVATASAGIAASLGYPDGEVIPRREMLEAVAHIARAVSVPVSADLEAGYGKTPAEVAETARLLLSAGAVGMNLEDSTGDPAAPLAEIGLQVEKIRAVRATAVSAGIPLVLNARTDVYLNLIGDEAGRFGEAVRRANAYREAGADCIFVVDVDDPGLIARLVKEIESPLNVLAHPGMPPVRELEAIGVRRITFGGYPMRAAMAYTQKVAAELLTRGTYTALEQTEFTHSRVNELFEKV